MSLLQIEQPLLMTAYGVGLAFIYLLIFSIVLLISDRALPTVSPILGIFGSTASLGALAWSEERRRRKQLERLEHIKQQFADMLVHDLKKRMSSILLSFSVLEKTLDTPAPKSRQLMETIRASTQRLLLLTGNLLDIRKIQEGHMALDRETVSLRRLVQESLREHLAAAELVHVKIALVSCENRTIFVDRAVFMRILSNLIWNALQHAPRDSSIQIACSRSKDNHLELSVSNAGNIIPPEEIHHIFDAFVSGNPAVDTLAEASTGLGLTFCKMAAEAHGGTIRILSPRKDQNDGVTVILTFPSSLCDSAATPS
jgi:signal transduction histidine kinase